MNGAAPQARALKENTEYILPVRFDDTPIPGLPDTVHYVDGRLVSCAELADLIRGKIGDRPRTNYLPPVPDVLFDRLELDEHDDELKDAVTSHAWSFMTVLQRMNDVERQVLFAAFRHGCPADLPNNIHIDTDLLRRCTGMPVTRLKRILGGLQSLGFSCTVRKGKNSASGRGKRRSLGNSEMFVIDWANLSVSNDSDFPGLVVAFEMVTGATEGYCEEHGLQALQRLDFSQLACATTTEDVHD